MATGDLTPARRIPVPESGDINEIMWDMKPGDYCGPYMGYTGTKPCVCFILPGGTDLTQHDPPNTQGFGHVTAPPHSFTEQPDGSLEIRESILYTQGNTGWTWHGYLDAGNVWREV